MRRKFTTAGLTLFFAVNLPLVAHMGDTIGQAEQRYGRPVAKTGHTGNLTSTETFNASGMQITCGYVDKHVEAIVFTRGDRAFVAPEVEALLRTNAQHKNWTPDNSGTAYTRADGAKAELKGTTLAMATPKWLDAMAKDEKAKKAAAGTNAASATMP